jgi:hypothetical protein
MSNYYHHVADGDLPTQTEILNWKRDTKRFKKNKGQARRNLIKGHLASILSRLTLSNSTTSALLALSLFGLITHVYA